MSKFVETLLNHNIRILSIDNKLCGAPSLEQCAQASRSSGASYLTFDTFDMFGCIYSTARSSHCVHR